MGFGRTTDQEEIIVAGFGKPPSSQPCVPAADEYAAGTLRLPRAPFLCRRFGKRLGEEFLGMLMLRRLRFGLSVN